MKLSGLVALATLGVASAAPLSIVYISSVRTVVKSGQVPSNPQLHPLANIRLGHAAAFAEPQPRPVVGKIAFGAPGAVGHHGCGGFRAKMDKMREFFGLPPVVKEEEFHIMPMPMLVPVTPSKDSAFRASLWKPASVPGKRPQPQMHQQTFGNRLFRALNQLGPWEGRAITFVFGCGLGVLLRMFLVFGILLVRAHRKRSQQPIELPADGEVIFVAPPVYFVEVEETTEKAPLYEEVATATKVVAEAEDKPVQPTA